MGEDGAQQEANRQESINPLEKRILIVDDDPQVRRTVRTVLESQGYTCIEVADGGSALNWLDTDQADLVISDSHMPVLSGIRFLTKLLDKCSKHLPVPVIVLSGNLNSLDRQKALQIGAKAVLEKPCNFRELVTTVARAMDSDST